MSKATPKFATDLERDLYAALKMLSDMYTYAWDTVDGGLLMMESGVAKFEAAHEVAYVALAKARGETP